LQFSILFVGEPMKPRSGDRSNALLQAAAASTSIVYLGVMSHLGLLFEKSLRQPMVLRILL